MAEKIPSSVPNYVPESIPGDGSLPDIRKASGPELQPGLSGDPEFHKEVTKLREQVREAQEDKNSLAKELAIVKAQLRKEREIRGHLETKADDLDEDNKIGEFGLKEGLENKIRESDAAVNDNFVGLLARQARDALSRPGEETFMKINDKATREIVLEEWKNQGVIPKDLDIKDLADLPKNERAVAVRYLHIGGGFIPNEKRSPTAAETFSVETREEYETPNLISGEPPEGRSNAWEDARSIYVHDIDTQEIRGLISATIGNIDSMFLKKISNRDREWIRNRVEGAINEVQNYTPEILLPKMGLGGGSINNLRKGIDTVNLLPVFGNETIMMPIIKEAKENKELEEPESVAKILEDVLTHAKATKASI